MINNTHKLLSTAAIVSLFGLATAGDLAAQRVHNTSLRVGEQKSLRTSARLQKYQVQVDPLGQMVVRAWFDTRAQRLRIQGIRPGTARVTFSGTSYYVSAGIPKTGSRRRPAMQGRSFQDVIHVTVRAAYQAPSRRPGATSNTNRSSNYRTVRSNTDQPRRASLPRIDRALSKTLGKGRTGSISLEKLFGGPAARQYALSASHRGVISARVQDGRLQVRGLAAGSTMLYIRGKVLTSRGLQDVLVKFHLTVR